MTKLVLLLSLLLTVTSAAAFDRVVVDPVTLDHGEIGFWMDDGSPLEGALRAVDPPRWLLAPEAERPTSIALLVCASESFTSRDPDIGMKWSLLDRVMPGLLAFAAERPARDRVGVWAYHEDGLRTVLPFGASARVSALDIPYDANPGAKLFPQLYRAVDALVDRLASEPGRRLLLLASDGLDRGPSAVRAERIADLAAKARAADITIQVIGVTFGNPDPLTDLASLARATSGGTTWLPDYEDLYGDAFTTELVTFVGRIDRERYAGFGFIEGPSSGCSTGTPPTLLGLALLLIRSRRRPPPTRSSP